MSTLVLTAQSKQKDFSKKVSLDISNSPVYKKMNFDFQESCFEEYWSKEDIQAGLKRGTLYQVQFLNSL